MSTSTFIRRLLTVVGIVAIALAVALALAIGEYLNWEDRGYLGRDEGEQS